LQLPCLARWLHRQDQQRRTVVKRARKTNALPLPARETHTAFTHVRVEAKWQISFNEVEYLRHGASFTQPRGIDLVIQQAKRDVARDRIVDEKNILWHITDGSLPRGHQLRCKRPIIDQDFARRRPI